MDIFTEISDCVLYLPLTSETEMKHLFFFILLFPMITMKAQPVNEEPALINHIALYVSDLKRSTAFYKQVFNLQQIEEPFKVGRHSWFSLGAAGQLHLIAGDGKKAAQNKNDHLCFSVRSMDAFIEKVDSMGIERSNFPGTDKGPQKRPDGVQQVYIQDPDGQWIEVNDDYRIFR